MAKRMPLERLREISNRRPLRKPHQLPAGRDARNSTGTDEIREVPDE